MITTHVMGGLGNQLFQIFNLISYCLTNKIPFYFEYKELADRSDRPFYWDNFLFSLKPYVKKNIMKICQYIEKKDFTIIK